MRKNLKIKKTTKVVLFAVFVFVIADWLILKNVYKKPVVVSPGLPSFARRELAKYNGDDTNLPIYLVLDGYVYDISAGRADFYGLGQSYHDLAGKDSSFLLHLVGADIIKRKYSIVGVYKE